MSTLHELAEDNADLMRENNALRDDLRDARAEIARLRASSIRWEEEAHRLRRDLHAARANAATDSYRSL